ncbi:MAG TPA: nucleotidyltransferase [Firmicutes bacterium]|nr:nucleotidyltransferase [Bacillota bacterium]
MSINDKIEQLEKAFENLKIIIEAYEKEKDKIIKDGLRDSIIQRFEFVTELSWKLMKKYLDENLVLEVYSPRSVIKESYKQDLIENGELWLDILEDRNLISHTYDENTANRIKDNIVNKYVLEFEKFIKRIKEVS